METAGQQFALAHRLGQVVFLALVRFHDYWSDELFKWSNLPTAWMEDFGRWKVDVRDDLVVASGAHASDSMASPALTDDLRPSLIVDGTSNTVLLVEFVLERAVPRTAPRDFVFDPDNPLDGILILPDDRWLAGTADGSLQRLRAEISPQTVLHLCQKSDGHPIPMNERR